MKRFICLAIVFFWCKSLLFSQYENMQLPKFLPPTPTAFQLTKGADISVGTHSGTASFSVPLFEIQTGGGKIPLILNYSSNGLTVDEVSTRTGVNWNLNIGGVISRTVLDDDDEIVPFKTPPANPNNLNQLAEYLYPLSGTTQTGTYNTQPDEYRFNVNGLSGKFFYDHNGTLRLTSYSNVKIEKNPINTGSWKFKLTDAEGVLYTFGGNSATEKNKYSNMGCAKDEFSMQFSDVAYYVTKIEYPDGNYVNFNYGSYTSSYVGTVAQTFIAKETPGNPGSGIIWGSIPGSSATTCQSEMIQNCVMLQSVNCSNGILVALTYFNREDINGEKGLETITQSFNGTILNRFKLIYQYSNSSGNYEEGYYSSPPISFNRKRLFLKEIQNLGCEGTEILSTKIDYNDINGLPPRLSTAQDHFGYFNGKHNQFYVSLPPTEVNDLSICNESISPEALNFFNNSFTANIQADKEVDFTYAVKGSLQKITYPTGGSTSVEWESNTVNKFVTIYPAQVTNSMYALGTCVPGSQCAQTVTNNISVGYTQYINLIGAAGNNNGEDQLHSTMIVSIYNLTTSSLLYEKTLKFNQSFNELIQFPGNCSYRIELTSTTIEIPSSLTYKYRPGNLVQQYMNVIVPGLRVKKVTDYDGIGIAKSKYYRYHSIAFPDKSSGQSFSISNYSPFEHVVAYGNVRADGIPYIIDYATNRYHKIQAGSNYKSYLAANNSISYNAVIESEDEDYSNGCIEHIFGSAYNAPAELVHGNVIKNAPFADNSYMDGLENETRVYKNSNNSLALVSKTVNEYSTDTRNFSWYDVLVIQNRNASTLMYQFSPPGNPDNLMHFDIMKYPRYSTWVHLDKVTTYAYHANNTEQVSQKTITYDNVAILQPGSETFINSNGKSQKITYKYIKDYPSLSGLSSNAIAAASLMESKNIVNQLIDKIITKNNSPVYSARTNYKVWSPTVIKPEYLTEQIRNNAAETRIVFNNYDATGNIREMQKANDVKETYIWGYGNLYPVAKLIGTDYATAEQHINISVINNAATTETQMKTELNNLRNAFIGTNVQVSTFTYKPMVGISSETDPRGRTTTFTYDAFNRLVLIKDHDGNILKKICYNYAGQPENCN